MRILFIGDVVGRTGRACVQRWLPEIRAAESIDLVLANGENAAGGLGATPAVLTELRDAGVDVVTLGNHTWRKKELAPALDTLAGVVRPANYPSGVPGVGATIAELSDGRRAGVVNLQGRVFMEGVDCPFATGLRVVRQLRETAPVVVVDFHAEATAEKVAMGRHLDGECTAVIGTHTHVQTADECVFPKGTAYITDVGMTGPRDSVIGVETDRALQKFLTGMPAEFKVAKGNPVLCAVIVEADDLSGRALSIKRYVRFDP